MEKNIFRKISKLKIGGANLILSKIDFIGIQLKYITLFFIS